MRWGRVRASMQVPLWDSTSRTSGSPTTAAGRWLLAAAPPPPRFITASLHRDKDILSRPHADGMRVTPLSTSHRPIVLEREDEKQAPMWPGSHPPHLCSAYGGATAS